MSIELSVISALLSHKAYTEYAEFLDLHELKQQSPEAYRLFLAVKSWHETHETDLQLSEFRLWFELCYPGIADKQKAIYAQLIENTAKTDIRFELIEGYLKQLKETQIRRTIAVQCMDDSVPSGTIIENIAKLSANDNIANIAIEQEYVTTDLDDLMRFDDEEQGLTWRLDCLNRSIGQLRKGMFGIIFAPVEAGKTALWVSEVSYFARQLKDDEHAIIYFNEEEGKNVMWRIYSSICGATAEQIQSNPERAKALFAERGGHRIKFIDTAQQNIKNVQSSLDKLNPKIIVMDNLDKFKGFEKEERQDVGLGKLYGWAREIAKTYAPVMGVSQAVAPPFGKPKQWLTALDMANSKVSKPAEVDYLIGIGRKEDAGFEHNRYLSIPKNKRRGGVGFVEAERHGHFSVILHNEISTYKDIS